MNDKPAEAARDLGAEADFEAFPAPVEVDNEPYFIVKNAESSAEPYRLISAICPHAGGEVRVYGAEFVCPMHFWTFDMQTGECTNVDGEKLACAPVFVRDGRLYADFSGREIR